MSVPTRAELNDLIQERLASDPEFRATLTSDPRSAISELVGVDVPAAVKLTVHQESLTDIHIVLPATTAAEGEFSEDDLELVAGGSTCWFDYCDE
jgi:hypothetical protein